MGNLQYNHVFFLTVSWFSDIPMFKEKKPKSFTIPPFQTRQQCDWELEFRNSEFSFMCVNVTLLVLVTGKLDLWNSHCKNGQDPFPLDAQNCKG